VERLYAPSHALNLKVNAPHLTSARVSRDTKASNVRLQTQPAATHINVDSHPPAAAFAANTQKDTVSLERKLSGAAGMGTRAETATAKSIVVPTVATAPVMMKKMQKLVLTR
jgi:hypothetical protein